MRRTARRVGVTVGVAVGVAAGRTTTAGAAYSYRLNSSTTSSGSSSNSSAPHALIVACRWTAEGQWLSKPPDYNRRVVWNRTRRERDWPVALVVMVESETKSQHSSGPNRQSQVT